MRSRAATIIAIALIAPSIAAFAAIVSAQEGGGGPSVVVGETLSCPGGEQVQSRFELDGNNWSVTGTLTAGLAPTITVSGPSGDVTATPTVNLAVSGNPQVGQPATMAGQVAETGEMVASSIHDACNDAPPSATPAAQAPPAAATAGAGDDDDDEDDRDGDDHVRVGLVAEGPDKNCEGGPGRAGKLRVDIKDGEIHLERGTVASFEGDTLSVQTPFGAITVLLDDDTDLRGDPAAALEVKLRGRLEDTGVVIAEMLRVLCDGDEHGEDEAERRDDGEDRERDDRGRDDDDDGGDDDD